MEFTWHGETASNLENCTVLDLWRITSLTGTVKQQVHGGGPSWYKTAVLQQFLHGILLDQGRRMDPDCHNVYYRRLSHGTDQTRCQWPRVQRITEANAFFGETCQVAAGQKMGKRVRSPLVRRTSSWVPPMVVQVDQEGCSLRKIWVWLYAKYTRDHPKM